MSEIQESFISGSDDLTQHTSTNVSVEKSYSRSSTVEVGLASSTTGVEDLLSVNEGNTFIEKSRDKDEIEQKSTLVNGTGESANTDMQDTIKEKIQTTAKELSCSDFQLKSPVAVWMKSQNINSTAIDLIYWRDLKKTGLVFVSALIILISLTCCSVISVISSVGLSLLVVAFLYRIGMTIVNAVQKTSAEHPFKNLLEEKLEIPEDKVEKLARNLVGVINKEISCLQKMFLIKDVIESIKFGLMLWLLSYVGAWFSLITMVILAFIVVFTIPKLYEEKQKEIDQLFEIVKTKSCEIYGTVESKLPEKVKQYLKKSKKD